MPRCPERMGEPSPPTSSVTGGLHRAEASGRARGGPTAGSLEDTGQRGPRAQKGARIWLWAGHPPALVSPDK